MYDLITSDTTSSSSRAINILGAVTGTAVVVYYGMYLQALTYDMFAVYLGYCGGVYGVGKYLDKKGDAYAENTAYGYKDNNYNNTVDNPDVPSYSNQQQERIYQ